MGLQSKMSGNKALHCSLSVASIKHCTFKEAWRYSLRLCPKSRTSPLKTQVMKKKIYFHEAEGHAKNLTLIKCDRCMIKMTWVNPSDVEEAVRSQARDWTADLEHDMQWWITKQLELTCGSYSAASTDEEVAFDKAQLCLAVSDGDWLEPRFHNDLHTCWLQGERGRKQALSTNMR